MTTTAPSAPTSRLRALWTRATTGARRDPRRSNAMPQPAVPFGTASDLNGEQSVVVVFDLYAPTHEEAARHLARHLTTLPRDADVDAWWFPEPQDKHVDRNDRDPMVLQPIEEPPTPCTCLPDTFGRHGRGCDAYDGWRE
ncbi:hypothetical protein [Cellulomonas sp. Y8]|uniref:hypothetical protein n=1 Tax=Cellulomonas sp. Y8 TaxID=2591145 RepID=UPI003D70DDD7